MTSPAARARRTNPAAGLVISPAEVDLLRTELEVLVAEHEANSDIGSADYRRAASRARILNSIIRRLDRLMPEEKDDDSPFGDD